jgi:methionyl-tRNA synthetase
MTKKYYITTPIYYVNDKPHIGHSYTNIAADILARFKRLDGYDVKFLTGTDEHGQKVEKSAGAKGVEPQKFVDDVSKVFKDLTKTLNLTNNDFIRTTEGRHKEVVAKVWQKLEENGHIYLGKYEGWYAIRDEAFYNEDELIKQENGTFKAPSGADVEWKEEECYFFKLSNFQDKLLKYYINNPSCIAPKSRYNEVVSFVKSGLTDLAISRTTFSWGIPVPGNPKHVIYVWLDALTNYITAIGYPNLNQDYWDNCIHLVGKDIIRFHTVYWFAFLMGLGINPPQRVFAHGWWLNEGQKISKSLGNVIDPNDLIATYGLDSVRYFMFKEVSFGSDGDFSKAAIITRINSELANEYGNLLQRSLSITAKNFNLTLENVSLGKEDEELLANTNATLEKCKEHIDAQELLKYIEVAWELIRQGNSYINTKAPWVMLKQGQVEEAKATLYVVAEVLRRVSLLLNPIMPDSTGKILDQLNVLQEARNFANFDKCLDKSSHKFNNPEVVFQKIIEG